MKSKDLLERYKQFLVTNDAAGLFGDVTTSQGRRRSSNTETRERFLGWVSELAEVQVNGSTGEKTLALRPEQWSRRTTPSGLGFGCTTTELVRTQDKQLWMTNHLVVLTPTCSRLRSIGNYWPTSYSRVNGAPESRSAPATFGSAPVVC